MNPIVAANKWLYAVLTADATIAGLVGTKVIGEVVPTDVNPPYIYYTLTAPEPNLQTLEANTIWSSLLYTVRMVDRAESYNNLETGAAAIVDALNRASGSNASGVILASVYVQPFALMEIDRAGFELRHLGAQFRLFLQ